MFSPLIPVLIIIGSILLSAIKIVKEYERLVIFRLGRFSDIRGPGLILLIPFIEKAEKVDLRTLTLDIPSQDCITLDNVTLKINGVVYFKISNPELAIIAVENYIFATEQIAQTTLRSVIGQFDLDGILSKRDEINGKIQRILDEQTEPWGIKISNVELKAIDLPPEMQRAMAKQAEAEREKRAKVISAAGERDAAKLLSEAAAILGQEKNAIVLRYLDTMKEIASAQGSTTNFFPFPMDFLNKITAFIEPK